jgi:hypothetical protein
MGQGFHSLSVSACAASEEPDCYVIVTALTTDVVYLLSQKFKESIKRLPSVGR